MSIQGSRLLRLAVAGSVAITFGASFGTQSRAAAVTPPTYSINRVGGYGGEPSITSDSTGRLYEASLAAAKAFRSTDAGVSWTAGATSAFSSTGDDCLGTNQLNELFLCN